MKYCKSCTDGKTLSKVSSKYLSLRHFEIDSNKVLNEFFSGLKTRLTWLRLGKSKSNVGKELQVNDKRDVDLASSIFQCIWLRNFKVNCCKVGEIDTIKGENSFSIWTIERKISEII